MTITVNDAREEYTASAGQTVFNYTFKIFESTDLNVYITPTGQVANDLTDITTAYTVTNVGAAGGGTIVLTVGATLNDLVTIVSNIPSSRTTDYQSNGDFLPATVNDDFDRVISIVKKIEDTTNRAVVTAQSQQGPKPLSLPQPVPGKILRWNGSSDGLENVSPSDVPLDTVLTQDLTITKATVAAMTADVGITAGQFINVEDYATGNNSGVLFFKATAGAASAPDGGSQIDHDTLSLHFVQNLPGHVDPKAWGSVGDGATTDTTTFMAAYAYAGTNGIRFQVPGGTFKGKFTFDGSAAVFCAGMRQTFFTPTDTAWCIRMYGTSVNGLGSQLQDCSIQGSTTGVGLECGDAGAASSFSNGRIENVEITGFATAINVSQATMCSFKQIYTEGNTSTVAGIKFGSERSVNACHFDTCRFRLADVGIDAQAGHNITWTNCNVESNRVTGLKLITGLSSGPTDWIFNGGDIEDNGGTPGGATADLVASVYIDSNATIGTTKPNNLIFNRSVITSATGAYDISAIRAQYVVLDHCHLSLVSAGGFTSSKLNFNTGSNAVHVHLKQCGENQVKPTKTMYASFPALFSGTGGPYGFTYEFEDAGLTISNRSLSREVLVESVATLTSYDVRGVDTISMDTTAGNLIVNSFDNGIDGQVIRIIKPVSANTVTITHNGTGTEKIFAAAGGSVTLNLRDGMTLVCRSSTWYQSDK